MANLKPLVESRRALRSAANGLSLKELETLVTSLQALLKSEKEKADRKAEAEKKAQIEKISKLMAEAGIKPSELKGGRTAKGKKRAKRKSAGKVPPKYRIVVDGKEHLWTGRGRTPKVFEEYFSAGNSRESALIDG
jgi:DNA-binding protein H-NS